MKSKSFFWLLMTVLLITVPPAEAQQPTKIPRIGYVAQRNTPTPGNPDSAANAFQQGLRDLGYVEGKNILLEHRYAVGKVDRIPGFVTELVQMNVDVLVAIPIGAIRAAKQATKTIPIVMVTTADPVASGLIDNLARPGGNITGVTRLTRELSGKRLELLKEVVPKVSASGSYGLRTRGRILKTMRLQLEF